MYVFNPHTSRLKHTISVTYGNKQLKKDCEIRISAQQHNSLTVTHGLLPVIILLSTLLKLQHALYTKRNICCWHNTNCKQKQAEKANR